MRVPLEEIYGNPSSLHRQGRKAAELLEMARSKVAKTLGASDDQIIFTSGATEANNLALGGILRAQPPERRHLITSAIEHHAVLHAAENLEREGCQLTILPVDTNGRVDPAHLRKALTSQTALVSIMMVNNEIGTIQPITELAAITRDHGALFHTDAVQAIGTLPVEVNELGVDLLSISAHKIYGPKGVGALYCRPEIKLDPMLHGGPQEHQRRAGTENLPGIVGLGAAMELILRDRGAERSRLTRLRQNMIATLLDQFPDCRIHGGDGNQAAHILSVAFPGVDAEMLIFHLDRVGISASMGSACNAEAIEPSHVLLALGLPLEIIGATVRFSLGSGTTEIQLAQVLDMLPDLVQRSRDG